MSTCRQEPRRMYALIQKYFRVEGVGFRVMIMFSGMGGGGKDQTTILVLHVALVPMKFRFYRGSPDSLATSSDSPCFAHRAKQLLHLQRQILHLRPPFVLRNLYKHKLKVITFPTCRFLARHLTLNVVTIFTKYA